MTHAGMKLDPTPGPWTAYQHFATPMPDKWDVVGATRDDDVAENLTAANAILISAAPDLLAALLYLQDEATPSELLDSKSQCWVRACAAITKATGVTP